MTSQPAPDDFDWVTAQAGCSAAAMFERLRTRVQEDVRRRNELPDQRDDWTFEFDTEGDGEQFEAVRVVQGLRGAVAAAVVKFERAGRHIHVHGEDVDVEFTAIVTVDPGGHCRFVIQEATYAEWEVARMALEQLFFDEGAEEE